MSAKPTTNRKTATESTVDLTVGRPLVRILVFSIPLILGTLFQQLYSFADAVIVGRLIGDDALGAVGATYSLNFLILGFVQGACIGFSIPAAQSFGAKDERDFRRFMWNGVWLGAIMSVIFTASMTLLARPLLAFIDTPAELMGMAVEYIVVIFLGIPSAVLYNHSAALMRSAGDSKHPFYFLLVSCVVNVVLNYVFIGIVGMGVIGSALATVIGQTLSAVLNCWWAFTRIPIFRIRRDEMRWSRHHIARLCYVGLPMGFEHSVCAVGAVAMQGAINSLGAAMVTAQTAGERIRQMFTLPMESVGMAIATYAGQNYGARRLDRIRLGLRDGVIIQASYCVVSWVVIFLFKEPMCRFVLGDARPEVMDAAVEYLFIMSCFFLLHGSLMIFLNTLQGMGYSTQAIISGFGELAGRCLGGWLTVAGGGYLLVCLSNPMAWAFALTYCVVMVTVVLRRASGQFSMAAAAPADMERDGVETVAA
ncbi:MATE family efflux transporter [Bifidobacterium sp. SMB2]|uniref:MATE family efflux transporter n=1 Tax=Bifidobacterium saimiriisciurei TaxID=2661627 RepID=A0ABX0C8T5_9BIFI|nr:MULTISPECIES: MATE family efflux transporter [Bifidobacterium]NEG96373.1 MATE family efflux transporter [Bifidobacterium sp. SMB2]NEH10995.1 MATE family efflux transporter [Bifidobacterium saimiriisciurei]